MRIGSSIDIHRLVENRRLVIGGIEIPYSKGCLAHSDGDVLIHAIVDALIGALGLGDIGEHFSDKDPKYQNIDSTYFLKEVKNMLDKEGYEIENIDSLVILEQPRLKDYKVKMKENIALHLGIDASKVNVKAGTNEGMGPIGRNEAIEAHATVLIRKVK